MPPTPQILIVGAGPVGLVLASELARRNVPVRIIDHAPAPSNTSRAVLIHARTLEIFADMDLLEPMLEAGRPIHGASVFAGKKLVVRFPFDELDSAYRFALDLPQPETERILLAHLESLGVVVERRTTLVGFDRRPDSLSVFLRAEESGSHTAQVSWLVGCDGAQSTVRHTLGVHFGGDGEADNYLLADVRIDWDRPDDEWFSWLHEDGLISVFPLPNGLHRVIVAGAGAAGVEDFHQVWNARIPLDAKLGEPVWISGFRLLPRKVEHYRQGRALLAGDAAHVMNPAGGQGMNTGIQDAYNLAWKLALVVQGHAPESLIDSYSAEREPVARGAFEFAADITSLATLRHPLAQGLRNSAAGLLSQFENIQQRAAARLGATRIHYRNGVLAGEAGSWRHAALVTGDRAPAIPRTLGGEAFKLLLFTGNRPDEAVLEQFAGLAHWVKERFPGIIETCLIAAHPASWTGTIVPDPDGSIHSRYGARKPCLYLIRPDKYVAFRSSGIELQPLANYLQTLIC